MGYGGDKCPKCGSTHTSYDSWNKENVCQKMWTLFLVRNSRIGRSNLNGENKC